MKNSERMQARRLLEKFCDEQTTNDNCRYKSCSACPVKACMVMLADKPARTHD